MQTATNPQTNQTAVLVNGTWQVADQIATNPKDGSRAYLVGNQWLQDQAPQTGKPEGYTAAVQRTGEDFDKAAGPGIAGAGKTAVAAGETAASMISGVAGDVGGALTSIATQDAKKGEAVRSAMTYQPRTAAGKAASEYVGALTKPVSKALNAVPSYLTEHGHPIMGQTVRAAEDVAGGAKALEKSPAKMPGVEIPKSINAELATQAHEAGYVLKPSEVAGKGKVGTVAEGMTGSPRLSIEASLKNQKVTNKLAAEEIGLPGASRVTKAAITKAKAPHNAVYSELSRLPGDATSPEYSAAVAKIGTRGASPEASAAIEKLKADYADVGRSSDAVQSIRSLRNRAQRQIKNENPDVQERGYAARGIADALEDEMQKRADAAGKPDLVKRYKDARTSLAKIHSVESALIGNTGEVSAQGLAKQMSRGVPLSGKLKIIADTAQEFQEAMRDGPKLRNKVPVTVLEGVSGGLGAGLSAGSHPILGGAALGGMIARPLTRKFLLSDFYQNKLAGPVKSGAKPSLADIYGEQ